LASKFEPQIPPYMWSDAADKAAMADHCGDPDIDVGVSCAGEWFWLDDADTVCNFITAQSCEAQLEHCRDYIRV
jgi:hypothetical protein